MLPTRPLNEALARVAPWLAFLSVTLAWIPSASAYAWMVRHGYTACAMCHADPSGGGLLTPYGRAQGSLLLATRWGGDDEAAARLGEFLLGAVHLPEEVLLGGEARGMELVTSVDGQDDARFILMQADLQAGVNLGRFHADGSLGFAMSGAFAASIVGDDQGRLVSRNHWLGVDLDDDHAWLLRAGRLNVPFGVRIIEHTAWVRASTRTDNNVAQQHGLALAYTGDKWRGEIMGIAGNFQISPDDVRERGYSASLEYAPSGRAAVGASSLVTHAARDLILQAPVWRQAHGLFARASPAEWLAVMAEADFLLTSLEVHNATGLAAWAQADIEPTQGLHLIATLECQNRDFSAAQGLSVGGWAGVAWFFFPHIDVRIDGVLQSVSVPGATVMAESFLAQMHLYL